MTSEVDRGRPREMNARYRLLGLDLDGTLLNEDLEIEQSTARKLAELSSRGVEIVLCSGRRFSAAVGYAHQLGLTGPIVVNNGTIVKEVATSRSIYTDYFPQQHLAGLLELLKGMDLPAVLLTDEYPEYDFCVDVTEGANEYHTEYLELNREMGRVVDDLAAVQCKTVSQVNVFHSYPIVVEAERTIRQAMDGKVGTVIIQHVKYRGCSLEMAALDASKWKALRWIAQQRGIQPEEIVAIGDEVNDTEMVREAGFGVAVANALDEVKAAADYVTKQAYNRGVEEAIDLAFQ
jgi:Cof subfamily protein (haloacid dehalogenase superfamily)